MFRELLTGTPSSPLLKRAFDDTDSMFEANRTMFEAVAESFLSGGEPSIDIEYMDEDVNVAERIVRRMVFEHITIEPRKDITAAVVLLSVVHDAERVGDYIKALLRLSSRLGFLAPKGRYHQDLTELIDSIRPMFETTRRAFLESDEDHARQIFSTHARNRQLARDLLQCVIDDELIDRRQAVLVSSGSRSLKRISAHLANIASSVVHPFDKIGHKDEDA
ncbi:MAG: PhoU domain-containing protein [Candidatus Eiseniibacteriota bacterium]|jgi:Na+/phosphate symporter